MWDLNAAERRALAASAVLVGLAGLSRTAWAPAAGDFQWEPVAAGASASPREAVSAALVLEARAQTPLAPDERIDIGVAPAEELRRLPGVGPSLAEAIIRERTSRPFVATVDLDRVPGIGPATLDRLIDRIQVGASIAGVAGPAPASPPGGSCGMGRIDINAAGLPELDDLPGVGPALADRIIRRRREAGPFDRVSELSSVSGIGPASLARIAPLACVR